MLLEAALTLSGKQICVEAAICVIEELIFFLSASKRGHCLLSTESFKSS